jgi:hypothetical protein
MATTLEPSPSGIQSAQFNETGPADMVAPSAMDRLMLKVLLGCFALMATIMLLDLLSGLWVRCGGLSFIDRSPRRAETSLRARFGGSRPGR